MRKPLRRYACALGMGFALALVGHADASSVYQITVTVTDNTTSATHSFTAIQGTTNDVTDPGSPNAINTINIGGSNWATFETTTGLTLSGFNSVTNNPGTSQATISLGGTIQVTSQPNTDSYTITTQVSQINFTNPLGSSGLLKNSESSTISNTTGSAGPPADLQSIQSWYDKTNTLDGIPGTAHTPLGTYALPASLNTTLSLSGPTLSTMFSPDNIAPFSLTERIIVNITGNGGTAGAQAKDVFGGTLVITDATPEPSSVVLLLTSIPLTLAAAAIRRRRCIGRLTKPKMIPATKRRPRDQGIGRDPASAASSLGAPDQFHYLEATARHYRSG